MKVWRNTNPSGSYTPLYINPRSVAGYGFDCPTKSLVNEFETGDPRLMHAFSTQPYANGRGAAFKAPASGRYLFPIPQTEIDLSGGSITQNHGY